MHKKFTDIISNPLIVCLVLSIVMISCPAMAKKPVAKKGSSQTTATSASPQMYSAGGDYLFRFIVPVDITLAGDLEKYAGSSKIVVSCSVYKASDTNYNNAGGHGSKIINLTNHSYKGNVTVDITSMQGNQLPHEMTKCRCVLLAPDPQHPGSYSLTVVEKFAKPGSKISYTGNL